MTIEPGDHREKGLSPGGAAVFSPRASKWKLHRRPARGRGVQARSSRLESRSSREHGNLDRSCNCRPAVFCRTPKTEDLIRSHAHPACRLQADPRYRSRRLRQGRDPDRALPLLVADGVPARAAHLQVAADRPCARGRAALGARGGRKRPGACGPRGRSGSRSGRSSSRRPSTTCPGSAAATPRGPAPRPSSARTTSPAASWSASSGRSGGQWSCSGRSSAQAAGLRSRP